MHNLIRRIEGGGRAGCLVAVLLAALLFPAAAPVSATASAGGLDGRTDGFPVPAGPSAAPDGLYLADASASPGAVFTVQGDGSLAAYFTRPAGALTHFAFSPAGELFYSDADDTRIYQVVDVGESIYYTAPDYVRDLAFDAAGILYFSMAGGGTGGSIWRFATRDPELAYTVPAASVDGFWRGDFVFGSAALST